MIRELGVGQASYLLQQARTQVGGCERLEYLETERVGLGCVVVRGILEVPRLVYPLKESIVSTGLCDSPCDLGGDRECTLGP